MANVDGKGLEQFKSTNKGIFLHFVVLWLQISGKGRTAHADYHEDNNKSNKCYGCTYVYSVYLHCITLHSGGSC